MKDIIAESFNKYMTSKKGKNWKEETHPGYIKSYKQAFRAGFKAAIKDKKEIKNDSSIQRNNRKNSKYGVC